MPHITAFIQRVVDARDPDIASHQSRLRSYAEGFAKHLSLNRDDTYTLAYGAEIHDIGKLSISESILHKPSRLTHAEYLLIQQHTRLGAELIQPLSLDDQIVAIVLHHHENFDGSGYPARLSGEKIPLLARIVRIIDSYDAITEDRPYHKGAQPADAIAMMHSDAHWYDPDLLREFTAFISIT
ncbi:HD-GYP domain-containing protein (c-di-GMP phosphodiesterase class II) [Marinobacterium sp. MBR-111]|jgi:HD-GYP domain-containing protein (c-di-GMP phosphodiesterase class II)|uniref:HD-GYP domain-containing protein n=1 Tax=Marinobacterium sp. MBR-111 TaxID=3156463 RepID=UPI0033922F9A